MARVADVESILNLEFYDDLANSGLPIPLDFGNAVGPTLVDCILIRRELWSHPPSVILTLFHELVHVVQINMLGLRKHIELYADNLIQSGYRITVSCSKDKPIPLVKDLLEESPHFQ